MVFGPGLIVMEADNDAGAVSTYVQAGAQYGTHLLWLMLLLLPITYFIQEMVVRLGIATGKGHAAMIIELLELNRGEIRVAEYLVQLPDRNLLESMLAAAVRRVQGQIGEGSKPD
jgi:Natural resistance-associated macrophage protein